MMSARSVRFSAMWRALLVAAVMLGLVAGLGVTSPQQASAVTPTGGIVGTVAEFNGDPGCYADVALYTTDEFGQPLDVIAYVFADELGQYAFTGLLDGLYYVEDQFSFVGDFVTVAGGAQAVAPELVRPELPVPVESISGTVVDPSITGIPGVLVDAFEADPMVGAYWTASDYTNVAGQYTVPLDGGGIDRFYNIQFTREGYTGGGDGYWQANNSPLVYADDAEVTDIEVLAGQYVTGIDAEMTALPTATIRGTLLDDTASPVTGVNPASITIFDEWGEEIAWGDSDPLTGDFAVTFALPEGTNNVFVRFAAEGYADGFYAGDGVNVVAVDPWDLPGGADAIAVYDAADVLIAPVMPYVGYGTVNLTVTDDFAGDVAWATAEFYQLDSFGSPTGDPFIFEGDEFGSISCPVEAGSYKIRVSAFGWKDLWVGATGATAFEEDALVVEVVDAGSSSLTVELPYLGYSTISGTLRNKSGAALTTLPDLWAGTWFNLYRYDGDFGTFEWVDFQGEFDSSTGQYTTDFNDPDLGPLWTIEAGEYHIGAGSDGYLDSYYGPAGTTVFDEYAAESVFAEDGIETTGVDIKMSVGGTLTGTVKSTAGAPLENIKVTAVQYDPLSGSYDTWDTREAYTNASGVYSFAPVAATEFESAMPGLAPGQYALFFEDEAGAYLSKFYVNVRGTSVWELDEDPALASSVARLTVPDGTLTAPLVTLSAAGRIMGTISYGDMTAPDSAYASVYKYDSFLGEWAYAGGGWFGLDHPADALVYSLGNLDPGTYRVELSDDYSSEFYDGADGAADVTGGANVVVSAGSVVTNINAVLVKPAEVTVEVLDPSGYPLTSDAEVDFFQNKGSVESPDWQSVSWNIVDPYTGVCTTKLLPGTYRVRASYPGFASRFWDGLGSTANVLDATDLVLSEGETGGPSYQIQVADGGTISGTVVRDDDGTDVAYAEVLVFDAMTEKWVTATQADALGAFSLVGLNDGQYKVEFIAPGQGLIAEFYNDAVSPDSAATVTVAAAGTVDLGAVGLATGQTITGVVRDSGGMPIADAWVQAKAVLSWADGSTDMRYPLYEEGWTDADGAYTITGLTGDQQLTAMADGFGLSVYKSYPYVHSIGYYGPLQQPFTPVAGGGVANFTMSEMTYLLKGTAVGPDGKAPLNRVFTRLQYYYTGVDGTTPRWIDEVESGYVTSTGLYQFDTYALTAGKYRVQFLDPTNRYATKLSSEFTLLGGEEKIIPTTTLAYATELLENTSAKITRSEGTTSSGPLWTTLTSASLYGGSDMRTTTRGAKYTIAFNGNGIDLYGLKAAGFGRFNVTIDGGTPTVVNLSSTTTVFKALMFSKRGLASGDHTAVIETLDEGKTVTLDKAIVWGKALQAEATPNPAFLPLSVESSDAAFKFSGTYTDMRAGYAPVSQWTSPAVAKASGGSYKLAAANNASVNFAFTGDGIQIFGTKASNFGSVRITIDGKAWVVSEYSAAALFNVPIFTNYALGQGTHYVAIEKLSGTYAGFDRVRLLSTGSDPALISLVSPYESLLGRVSVPGTNTAGTGLINDKFTYGGVGWAKVVPITAAGPGARNWAAFEGGYYSVSKTAGNTFSMSFDGSGIAMYGYKRYDFGRMLVTIDNKSWVVSCYAPTKQPKQLLFQSLALGPGPHQLTIKVLDNLKYVGLDEALIWGDAVGTDDTGLIANPVRAEDSSTTAFSYFGGTTYWKSIASGSFSGGSARNCNTIGKQATFGFDGTGFVLYGTKGTAWGRIKVTVDGTKVYTVSAYAASTLLKQELLRVRGLEAGYHDVTIETIDAGKFGTIDFIDTFGTPGIIL